MKKTIGIVAATAFAVSAISAPAIAGNSYGKQINDACGASFGQLRQLSPHPVTPSAGAKSFVLSLDGLALHCLE